VSGFKVETMDDFSAILEGEWEGFIKLNTACDSWIDMQKVAGIACVKKQVCKGLK
jgi:hypothetical protein